MTVLTHMKPGFWYISGYLRLRTTEKAAYGCPHLSDCIIPTSSLLYSHGAFRHAGDMRFGTVVKAAFNKGKQTQI